MNFKLSHHFQYVISTVCINVGANHVVKGFCSKILVSVVTLQKNYNLILSLYSYFHAIYLTPKIEANTCERKTFSSKNEKGT